jgi:hypothetical protein
MAAGTGVAITSRFSRIATLHGQASAFYRAYWRHPARTRCFSWVHSSANLTGR